MTIEPKIPMSATDQHGEISAMTKDRNAKPRPSKEERKRTEQRLFAGMAKTKLYPIDQQPLTAARSPSDGPTSDTPSSGVTSSTPDATD